MACGWRRTAASVFLYLCVHNVRVLCQNVPNGARPLPILKESVGEEVVSGTALQQRNQLQSPSNGIQIPLSNGVQPEIMQRAPYNAGFQRLPDNLVQTRSQVNNGQCASRIQEVPVNGLSQKLGTACNSVTNIPQQGPSNVITNPLRPNPTCNPLVDTRTCPTPGSSSTVPFRPQPKLTQNPNCYLSLNLPHQPSQPVPTVPNIQSQAVPCPQNTLISPSVNISPGLQNPFSQTFATANPFTQTYVPNAPCLTTDLTSLKFLPTPNIPSTAVQNYVLTSQIPVQQGACQPPVEYVPNTAYLPNYQLSTLPPVYAVNQALCEFRRNPVPMTEDYTPVPINLSINVPTPTIPEPKITIITAYPQAPVPPVSGTTENTDLLVSNFYPPYPLPPIIIEGKRSRSRSWLPLILIALIANDDFGGGGCYCCPCPDTPIPYPIPIPTNSPIILRGRSRKKGTKAKTSAKTIVS